MDIFCTVEGQRLKIDTNLRHFAHGSDDFVRFLFAMTSDWDGLLTFAQFRQNGNVSNEYLSPVTVTENGQEVTRPSATLPDWLAPGPATMVLYGTGRETVIGTTNYVDFVVTHTGFVGDVVTTDMTETLYQQLINRFIVMEAELGRVSNKYNDLEHEVTKISGETHDATKESKGIVKIGDGLDVAVGVVSVDTGVIAARSYVDQKTNEAKAYSDGKTVDATTEQKGIVKIGSGLSVESGTVSVNTNLIATADALAAAQAQLMNMVGTPLKAATAAAMTDGTKIYVYTGTEQGMTAGNWYYKDGDDWVSGGTYNSTAFTTDKTLAVSDAAADAKVTGDALFQKTADLDVTEQQDGRIVNTDNAGWTYNRYVSNEDGGVYYTSQGISSTVNMIHIPRGCTFRLQVYLSVRIAMYDAAGSFISATSYTGIQTVSISSSDASFIRVQWPAAADTAKANCVIRLLQNGGPIARMDEVDNKLNDSALAYNSVTGSGNPIVLKDTAKDTFLSLELTDDTSDTELTVCGKNLISFHDYKIIDWEVGAGNIEPANSGMKFIFMPLSGGIRIRSTSAGGAGYNVYSSSSALGEKYKTTINGQDFYFNFKFRFPAGTVVSVSDNCAVPVKHNFGVQMRVRAYNSSTGSDTIMYVTEGGLTFKTEENTDYMVYFLVREGWTGDVTYYPQVEIGPHATAHERYDGYSINVQDHEDEGNLFSIAASEKLSVPATKVLAYFDSTNDEVFIQCEAVTTPAMRILTPSSHSSDYVNGVAWNYIVKFTGDGGYVFFDGIPEKYKGLLYGQISDGTNTWADNGEGRILLTEYDKEYGYRLYLTTGAEFEDTIRPVIVRGEAALARAKSRSGMTTIYTNDGASISANAPAIKKSEQIANSAKVIERINILTGGRISGTPFPRKPLVSFIDDDAQSNALVKEYHDILANKGIVGGFAIETDHIDLSSERDAFLARLRGYEDEGFDCLYHCQYQQSYTIKYAPSEEAMINHAYRYVYSGQTGGGYTNGNLYAWGKPTPQSEEQWMSLGPYIGDPLPDSGFRENTWYFVDGPNDEPRDTYGSGYSEDKSRANFVAGLKRMETYGFHNFNYWVTPYGTNNEFMKRLAMKYGMKCLISYPSNVYLYNSYVTRYGNVGKWDIPRVHFSYDSNGTQTKIKNLADACKLDAGWMIITTHVNSWPTDPTTRAATKTQLEEIIDYVQTPLDSAHPGMEVVPFSVGFETFKPYLDMHDLLK